MKSGVPARDPRHVLKRLPFVTKHTQIQAHPSIQVWESCQIKLTRKLAVLEQQAEPAQPASARLCWVQNGPL